MRTSEGTSLVGAEQWAAGAGLAEAATGRRDGYGVNHEQQALVREVKGGH